MKYDTLNVPFILLIYKSHKFTIYTLLIMTRVSWKFGHGKSFARSFLELSCIFHTPSEPLLRNMRIRCENGRIIDNRVDWIFKGSFLCSFKDILKPSKTGSPIQEETFFSLQAPNDVFHKEDILSNAYFAKMSSQIFNTNKYTYTNFKEYNLLQPLPCWNVSSHLITRVKQHWAWSVLGWVTAGENQVV